MGYDGTGSYSRQHNWSADASANIKILASRQDQEWDDLASAMNLALLRDGRAAMTGNLVMGGNRVVNVGAPLSATNYMRSKDFIENLPIYMVDGESSADRISVSAEFYTTASATTAPRDGSHILVKVGSDKSSAVAIRLNTGDGSPHSAGVVLANGSAIYSGALRSGGIYEFYWSSTDAAWQLFNPQVDYATSALPGVIQIATDAEAAAGAVTNKVITPAQLAAKFSSDYATVTSAGLVELATTAEVAAGTNVSAVITPSTLHSYASAATTASAGLLEIATTAEATAGTDASRAITPSTLNRAIQTRFYALTVSLTSVASAATVLKFSEAASAWTVSASALGIAVNHGLSLTSVHEAVINLQMMASLADDRSYVPVLFQLSADTFRFDFLNVSASTQSSAPASCVVHIQVIR